MGRDGKMSKERASLSMAVALVLTQYAVAAPATVLSPCNGELIAIDGRDQPWQLPVEEETSVVWLRGVQATRARA